MSCDADTQANVLLTSLLEGKSFELPETDLSDEKYQVPYAVGDLYNEIVKIGNDDLTTQEVGGSGVFDTLMTALSAHLKEEYKSNRITGAQYTQAYIAGLEAALGQGTQFLLQREQAYWQAVLVQQQARLTEIQVVNARVQLEVTKAQLAEARMRAQIAEAEYGLTKIRIATEDQQYCLLKEQTALVEKQAETADYNLNNILPAQEKLLKEQGEAQRAQTQDTRSDGLPVKGSVGKQKDLYTQQIDSYKRDAEIKAAKLFTDAWITQKTVDELTPVPGAFRIDAYNAILRNIKANNALDEDPGPQDGDSD